MGNLSHRGRDSIYHGLDRFPQNFNQQIRTQRPHRITNRSQYLLVPTGCNNIDEQITNCSETLFHRRADFIQSLQASDHERTQQAKIRCKRRRDTERFSFAQISLVSSTILISSHDTIAACGSTSNCTVYTCGIISLRHC